MRTFRIPKFLGKAKTNVQKRRIRHARVRNRVYGTSVRPRLAVFRSPRHISAQIIDDDRGHTLVSASDLEAEVLKSSGKDSKVSRASNVGLLVAQRASSAGVTHVVFDRAGYKYHGRIQALADAVREGGVNF